MLHRSLFACSLVLVCSSSAVADDVKLLPPDRPIAQVIDHYVGLGLKDAKVQAAPLADDAALIRRLTLDLVGRIPTVAETTAYLAAAPDKKATLVDRLMASSGFVRHQAQEFLTFLAVQEVSRKAPKKNPLHDYLLAAFAEKKSWDRIFRELMLPDENDARMQGAGEFLKSRVKDQTRLTIDVSIAFFGVNVSCAQCHDHPHVPAWTQDHFYGMKA